jgi:hypothetical protein
MFNAEISGDPFTFTKDEFGPRFVGLPPVIARSHQGALTPVFDGLWRRSNPEQLAQAALDCSSALRASQ